MTRTTQIVAHVALMLLLCMVVATPLRVSADDTVDPCASYSSTCNTCSNAPANISCGWCQGERSCRTGSMYGPVNATGCGVAEWWPHTPGANPATWCYGSAIATSEPCSTFTNSDACFASMPFYGCGWCSDSTFGGGQCQKRNTTAVPAQPQWMSGVVLPVCQLNATTGEPAFSFIDRCQSGSATRASCASLPSALGCGWCGDGSANPATANASCQAATAAGFLSGMTCAAESFLYPAAGYVDPCKRFSNDCESCSSAPAELNCGFCANGWSSHIFDKAQCQQAPRPSQPDGGGFAYGTCDGDYTYPISAGCPDLCMKYADSCKSCNQVSSSFDCTWCPSGSKVAGNVNASCKAASKNTQCAETPLTSSDICPVEPVDICAAYSANCTSCADAPAEYNCAYCPSGSKDPFGSSPACRVSGKSSFPFCSESWITPASACTALDQCKFYSSSCDSCATADSSFNCKYCASGSSSSSSYSAACQRSGTSSTCLSSGGWVTPSTCATPAPDPCKSYSSDCSTCASASASYDCRYCSTGSSSSSSSFSACQKAGSGASCYSSSWIVPTTATCAAPTPADECKSYSSSCSSCANAPTNLNCAYCSTGSPSSSASNAACQQSSATETTTCFSTAGWVSPSSSTCAAAAADPCKDFSSSCAACAQVASAYGCGWCSTGSTSPSSSEAACSRSGFSTCDGSFQQPAGGTSQTCDNSPPSPAVRPSDDPDSGSSTNFNPGTSVDSSKTKAAFPLVFAVLGGFIFGIVALTCVPALRPSAGIAAGSPVPNVLQRWASDRNFLMAAIGVQSVALVLLAVGGGVNSWSAYSVSDSGYTIKIDFGVLSMKTSAAGMSATSTYGCSLNGQSDTQKRQCVAFLIGGILTMLYEIAAAIFTVLAIIYAAMGLKNNAFSPRLWLFSGLALAASLAALLTWPLSSHLVLLNLMQTNGASGVHLSSSWGLMFTSVILSLLLLVFWRAVLQTRPAMGLATGTTMAMGVVASPAMFPAAQQNEMGSMPPQQFAQYPPQQQQYAQYPPQQQFAQYPPPQQQQQQQQQQPGGFVAPQANSGGFAQI